MPARLPAGGCSVTRPRDVETLVDLHGGELVAAVLADRDRHRAEQQDHVAAAAACAELVGMAETTLEWLQSGQSQTSRQRGDERDRHTERDRTHARVRRDHPTQPDYGPSLIPRGRSSPNRPVRGRGWSMLSASIGRKRCEQLSHYALERLQRLPQSLECLSAASEGGAIERIRRCDPAPIHLEEPEIHPECLAVEPIYLHSCILHHT